LEGKKQRREKDPLSRDPGPIKSGDSGAWEVKLHRGGELGTSSVEVAPSAAILQKYYESEITDALIRVQKDGYFILFAKRQVPRKEVVKNTYSRGKWGESYEMGGHRKHRLETHF